MKRVIVLAAVILAGAPWALADDSAREQELRERARAELSREPISHVVGTRARIVFENAVDRGLELVRTALALDGALVFAREGTGPSRFATFDGFVGPGSHTVWTDLTFRGRRNGVFSYLRGYRRRVTGRCTFVARQDRPVCLRVIVSERGSVTAPSGDPPGVSCLFADGRP